MHPHQIQNQNGHEVAVSLLRPLFGGYRNKKFYEGWFLKAGAMGVEIGY
jgi:hypothetical protein